LSFLSRYIERAIQAFQKRDFYESLRLIKAAWPVEYANPINREEKEVYPVLINLLTVLISQLPIIENTAYQQAILTAFRDTIENESTPSPQQWKALRQLLDGIYLGISFFATNQLDLEPTQPILTFEVDEEHIKLYKYADTPRVRNLVEQFNAMFEEEEAQINQLDAAIDRLLIQQEQDAAIELIEKKMEAHPQTKVDGFHQLGKIHYQAERYERAVDAFLKAILLGLPKAKVKMQIKTACEKLARYADTPKEAMRWRELFINYFGVA